MIERILQRIRRRRWFWAALSLVVSAQVSLLASSPGKVAGDTKLYLYLNPGRLISDSVWTWDNRQLGGWVPHQNVGYLWPTGPWYAFFDFLQVPDWVAQRLWLGTLMSIAGLGCLWLGRRLGLSVVSALVAAAAYEFTPYVLPYISRTSALLLPWAFLPWMCVLAVIAGRRWLAVSAFGALVLSSGGLNATALLMIAPGPLIWLVHEWREGRLGTRRTVRTAFVLGAVSILTSAWWLAGLLVQGRYGAAVLSYSESLVSTAATSSAPEVLRGLGYWIFYDRNDIVALTSASTVYQESLLVLAAGGAIVLVGLGGIIGDRRWRWPLMTMVLVGVVLAVGPHPFDDPSPLWSLAAENPKSGLSLALRSSTRAVPLVVLALALGLGSFIDRHSVRRHRSADGWSRRRILLPLSILGLVAIQAPAVVTAGLIDPAMTRPEELPTAWLDTAAFLDRRFDEGHTGSVLLVPGIESAAYRWGYPVDPILPGLTKKPFISRDWLPLGSAPYMDLLFALDDAFQAGTATPASIAPVARLLGADTVMVVATHQYERFGTVRPETAQSLFAVDPPGLRRLAAFGAPAANRSAVDGLESWSEDVVAHPPLDLPEIVLYEVDDPAAPARVSERPVLVAADGSGIVDLSAAGIIDGSSLVLAEAALTDDQIRTVVDASPEVVITDSNRRRAHHWRSSQDVWGATEPLSGIGLEEDLFDSRLPVFPRSDDSSRTVVEESPVLARATSYGPYLRYWPEYRPTMAVDGDVRTSWRTGVQADPIGQMIRLDLQDAPVDRLRLVQPLDADIESWITAVDVRADDGPWTTVQLSERSRTASGQIVRLEVPANQVTLRISAIDPPSRLDGDIGPGVGFAEMLDPERVDPEVLRLPDRLGEFIDADTPVSYAFTRWRANPLERWRSDPEASLRRSFTVTTATAVEPSVIVRLSPRANDALLGAALELDPVAWADVSSTGRLEGSPQWWAAAAIDGDDDTVWWSGVASGTEAMPASSITLPLSRPVSSLDFHLARTLPSSTPTRMRIEAMSGGTVTSNIDVDVPPADARGLTRVEFPSMDGERLVITLIEVQPFRVHDEQTGREITAPVGISEIESDGLVALIVPGDVATGCREDLITLDGRSLPVEIRGSVTDALAGRPLKARVCGDPTLRLEPGNHRLSSSSGAETGWDVDSVVLRSQRRGESVPAQALAIDMDRGRRTIELPTCDGPCWVELPDGWNPGWSATTGRIDLGEPSASAGGRNAWFLESSTTGDGVDVTWEPQRYMWSGLMITAVSVLFLAVLAVLDLAGLAHRRPDSVSRRRLEFSHPMLWALLSGVVGYVVVDPFWGIVIATLTICCHKRPRVLAALGWILVGLAMVFLVAQQVRTGADPGFAWPSVFARAHRPALAGIVVVWCAILAMDRVRSESR